MAGRGEPGSAENAGRTQCKESKREGWGGTRLKYFKVYHSAYFIMPFFIVWPFVLCTSRGSFISDSKLPLVSCGFSAGLSPSPQTQLGASGINMWICMAWQGTCVSVSLFLSGLSSNWSWSGQFCDLWGQRLVIMSQEIKSLWPEGCQVRRG